MVAFWFVFPYEILMTLMEADCEHIPKMQWTQEKMSLFLRTTKSPIYYTYGLIILIHTIPIK